MAANHFGAIVEDCWANLPKHYLNITLDAFVLMPNHVHGVIIIEDNTMGVGAGLQPALSERVVDERHSMSEIVRAFKTFSARTINQIRASTGSHVWQRGFYDHIIRSEHELNRVREYIIDNPKKWSEDIDNPVNCQRRRRV